MLMKKGINLAVFVIAMMFSVNALADDAAIKMISTKSFELTVSDMGSEFEISISDIRNRTIYNDHVRNGKNYLQQFNLEQLPTGVYFLQIKNDRLTQEYRLDLSNESVSVSEIAKKERFKPGIYFKNDFLHVNAFAMNHVSKVSVLLEDNYNKVIFNDEFRGEENFGKVYNTALLPAGTYKVTVRTNGQTTTKTVHK